MGLIRKTASVFTYGAIDFQSDKQRMARSARLNKKYSRQIKNQLKEQNKLMKG